MKRKHYFSCMQSTGGRLLVWALLLAAGLLTACTQDELTEQAGILPEGKYPLQIGSVSITADVDQQPWSAGVPQTRVSENPDGNSSHWDWNGTEVIGVQIEGSTKSGLYCLMDTHKPDAEKPVYWESTQAYKVRAWYPADGMVALNNQTTGLTYVLYAETTEAVDYKTERITLPFNHKLAKVRVKLTGDQAGDITDVKIKTYTSCTLDEDGTLKAGDTEDFIPMVKTTYEGKPCWEANVVPDYEITQVKVNDKEVLLSTPLTPLEAKVNTITLKAGDLTPADPITITDDGEYTITGSGDQTITINGNPTVTLDNVTISNDNIPIRITGGSPTLIIKGKTALTTTNANAAGIQLEGKDTHVRIQGDGTLEINNGEQSAGIGSGTDGTCGNIDIEGITVTISHVKYGAGIGGGDCGHCGDIKIENAKLTIEKPRGAAAIGCGVANHADVTITCGNIEIVNSEITATVGNNFSARPAAIGCCGAFDNDVQGKCGDITITLKSGQDRETFLSKLTIFGNVEKVGLGGYDDNLKGKVGIITWKNADGTVIETTPARDL